MSADITFGDNLDQIWSARSWYFEELMRRASSYCKTAAAIEALRMAGEVGFLIMQVFDVLLRKELCDAVAAAGRDLLAELSPTKPFAEQEAKGNQRLIALAEQCAADAGSAALPNG
jgi:hypothetical protein